MSEAYEKMKQPPKWALREIAGGRLKGKTDINPQWRYEVMDETYGACGVGWKYEIERLWTEQGANSEVSVQATVKVFVKDDKGWSEPISGIGGSMLVENEKNGLRTNDEAYKMAVTDALSVALKFLGVGADVYKGLWDGTKYNKPKETQYITPEQFTELQNLGADMVNLAKAYKVASVKELTFEQAEKAILTKRNQKVKEDANAIVDEQLKKEMSNV